MDAPPRGLGVWEGEATTRHLDLEAELRLWSGVGTADPVPDGAGLATS